MESLAVHQIAALTMAAVFGAIWGSFLNVCIARIPRGMSVIAPPSHCFACGSRVRARDNIPILSYFLLHGRCRKCGAQFSGRHALVEALTGVLSALVLWSFTLDAPGMPVGVRVARYAVYFAFAAVLVVLTFIDLDTKRLPDIITLPAVGVFFVAGFATGDVPWLDRLIGAAAGYLVVRLIADAYYYSTGREGLGLGDGKLLAVIGALLGWKSLPPIICAASLVGILVSVPTLLIQRRRQKPAAVPADAPLPTLEPARPSPPDGSAVAPPTAEPAVPSADGEAAPPPDAGAPPPAPTSIRRTEVPFGPFLSASALAYLFLHRQVWALIERALIGG
jgi:leader peptidase (prepilin peptidase) / N-methyltransferase